MAAYVLRNATVTWGISLLRFIIAALISWAFRTSLLQGREVIPETYFWGYSNRAFVPYFQVFCREKQENSCTIEEL